MTGKGRTDGSTVDDRASVAVFSDMPAMQTAATDVNKKINHILEVTMLSIQKTGPGLAFRSLLLAAVVTCLPQIAAADNDVPPSVAALLPSSLKLDTQSFGVMEHEFGKVINAQIHAGFPKAVTCDFTMGPDFNLDLQGDNAWEADPEQLAMFEQMFLPEVTEPYAQPHSDFVKTNVKDIYGELTIGEDRSEQLPNGNITYTDFTWKCPKNPGGENVMLSGYAHRGSTILTFSFWANGTSKDAIVLAKEIFAQFEKMDLAELYGPPVTMD